MFALISKLAMEFCALSEESSKNFFFGPAHSKCLIKKVLNHLKEENVIAISTRKKGPMDLSRNFRPPFWARSKFENVVGDSHAQHEEHQIYNNHIKIPFSLRRLCSYKKMTAKKILQG